MTFLPELAIIKTLLIYNIYNKYNIYINTLYIKELDENLFQIFLSLYRLMEKEQRDCSLDDLQTWFLSEKPNLKKKERDCYSSIFQEISKITVSESIVEELLEAIKRKEQLQTLAIAAFDVSSGTRPMEDVQTLFDEISKPVQKSEATEFVTDDLELLYTKAVKEPGLRWRLNSLNQSLGSLRKGDFGFIFARPETGKTTLLASEITNMASQVSSPILWFNNEEQGNKVKIRCYQAALGIPLEQLFIDRKKAQEEYLNLTKGNIKIYDQSIITKTDVEQICYTLLPSLIVFDQIDKISGFRADRNDLELGEIYIWARELAKNFAPVVGICQADGTAEGVKWLTMGHVVNAKTSKQSEADWILGIGLSHEAGYEFTRHFNVSKNKLLGDEDSTPTMRHGRWDVQIEPSIARYKDYLD